MRMSSKVSQPWMCSSTTVSWRSRLLNRLFWRTLHLKSFKSSANSLTRVAIQRMKSLHLKRPIQNLQQLITTQKRASISNLLVASWQYPRGICSRLYCQTKADDHLLFSQDIHKCGVSSFKKSTWDTLLYSAIQRLPDLPATQYSQHPCASLCFRHKIPYRTIASTMLGPIPSRTKQGETISIARDDCENAYTIAPQCISLERFL